MSPIVVLLLIAVGAAIYHFCRQYLPKFLSQFNRRTLLRIGKWTALAVAIALTLSQFWDLMRFVVEELWNDLGLNPIGSVLIVLAFVAFMFFRRSLKKLPAEPKPEHEAQTH